MNVNSEASHNPIGLQPWGNNTLKSLIHIVYPLDRKSHTGYLYNHVSTKAIFGNLTIRI